MQLVCNDSYYGHGAGTLNVGGNWEESAFIWTLSGRMRFVEHSPLGMWMHGRCCVVYSHSMSRAIVQPRWALLLVSRSDTVVSAANELKH